MAGNLEPFFDDSGDASHEPPDVPDEDSRAEDARTAAEDAETVRRLVVWLRGRVYKHHGKRGVPTWALVGTILGYEKPESVKWCNAHGLTPASKMRMTDG